jgi:hypothetical protein
MQTPPIQREIEKFLDDTLKHGDKEAVAAILGCDASLISKECNPNHPDKKSKFYLFARFLWACFQVRPELGGKVLQRLNVMARIWTPNEGELRNIPQLAGAVTQGVADLTIAEIEQRPMQERLDLALQVQRSVSNYIDGLRFDGVEDSREQYAESRV